MAAHVPLKNVYPAGRLDYESEGLLLLTDDGKLQARISQQYRKPPMAAMLTSGNGLRSISLSRSNAASCEPVADAIHMLWLRGTPLGWPVVPEVQQIVKISLAVMSRLSI